ncbi:hypothetical protein [Streptomyces sp. NPDC002763]|uniref:hypothetical protein n=1 Tax=Streptomyces sp. NPDC002763 TaxID=3154427 RepID=UPI003333D103
MPHPTAHPHYSPSASRPDFSPPEATTGSHTTLQGLASLPKPAADLVLLGDLTGRYATGSYSRLAADGRTVTLRAERQGAAEHGHRITAAIACHVARAGGSLDQLIRLLLHPEHEGGRHTRTIALRSGQSRALDYIRRVWASASATVSTTLTLGSRQDAYEVLAALRDRIETTPWRGERGRTALRVLRAHLNFAETAGGPLHHASERQTAEEAGISRTTLRAVYETVLKPGGWLRRLRAGHGREGSTWYLDHGSVPSHRVPALRSRLWTTQFPPDPALEEWTTPETATTADIDSTVLARLMGHDAFAHHGLGSAALDSVHEDLAQAVTGPDTIRIKGPVVYRIMAKIRRCVPTNVGTLDARNRSRRFQLAVGADVLLDYPEAERRNKSQTNIFVSGYEGGERVNVGASLKGRVWNYGVAHNLKRWVDWCNEVGAKLTDETVDPADVLKGFIIPTEIEERPELVPLALEWPIQFFLDTTESVEVKRDNFSWPVIDTDLTITTFSREGPIGFTLHTPHWSVDYQITIAAGRLMFTCDGPEPTVATSRQAQPFSEYLNQHGLRILFEDEAILEPDMLLIRPTGTVAPFSPERLQTIDWTGIDLHKESQGVDRDPTSIQARTIQHLLGEADWDLVIDDDGAGEVADIVAARIEGNQLHVNLVHCKYAHGDVPGARVADLYEVCGQVHKSTKWRHRPGRLFSNLIRREGHRREQGRSGLEKGTDQTLYELAQRAPLLEPKFTITIVQPGVSKARVSEDQLHLLACAEVYAMDTANSVLQVIVHP